MVSWSYNHCHVHHWVCYKGVWLKVANPYAVVTLFKASNYCGFWWYFITKIWSVDHIIIVMFIIGYATGGLHKCSKFMCVVQRWYFFTLAVMVTLFELLISHFFCYWYNIASISHSWKKWEPRNLLPLFFRDFFLRTNNFCHYASWILLHMLKLTRVKFEYICTRSKSCFGGLIEQSGYLVSSFMNRHKGPKGLKSSYRLHLLTESSRGCKICLT